jgi:hypothetical protein
MYGMIAMPTGHDHQDIRQIVELKENERDKRAFRVEKLS